MKAEDIADVIYYCATHAHACINDLLITPTQQASANQLLGNTIKVIDREMTERRRTMRITESTIQDSVKAPQ